MTDDEYHADAGDDEPSLSSSIAHVLISKSPKHAWYQHPRLNPDYKPLERDTFDLGTTVHAMLLERISITASKRFKIINAKDYRTKDAQKAKAEARKAKQTPILVGQAIQAQDLVDEIGDQVHDIIGAGKPEVQIKWRMADVLCRSKLDWLPDEGEILWDVKIAGVKSQEGAGAGEPSTWAMQQLWRGKSLIQSAMYEAGCQIALGRFVEMVFLVVECKPPFGIAKVGLSELAREIANDDLDRALSLWKKCLHSGEWPSYDPEIYTASPPGWLGSDYEKRRVERSL